MPWRRIPVPGRCLKGFPCILSGVIITTSRAAVKIKGEPCIWKRCISCPHHTYVVVLGGTEPPPSPAALSLSPGLGVTLWVPQPLSLRSEREVKTEEERPRKVRWTMTIHIWGQRMKGSQRGPGRRLGGKEAHWELQELEESSARSGQQFPGPGAAEWDEAGKPCYIG